MRFANRIHCVILCCSGAVILFSAASCLSQILPFHPYTVKDGLVSNSISKIYEDSRGYMWFGTADGLTMFDGKTFANYTSADGLPGNYVNEILEDRHSPGTLWVATTTGLAKFVDGAITQFDARLDYSKESIGN